MLVRKKVEVQSAQGFDLSVGSDIGMMVALLKQMHLQKETGLYAIYSLMPSNMETYYRNDDVEKHNTEYAQQVACWWFHR
jgi:hypothetical protein